MMTREEWCSRAQMGDVQNKIRHCNYSRAYPYLIGHFSKLLNPTWDDAIVALHVVYGWMPTIPETALTVLPTWSLSQREKLLSTLKRASSGEMLAYDDVLLIRSFCNKSMVGASKLLHFLCPRQNPIWDRNVAATFEPERPRHHAAVNNVKRWLVFRSELNQWICEGDVLDRVTNLRRLNGILENVSALRIIELVMFYSRE
jgi:hypothetical protein